MYDYITLTYIKHKHAFQRLKKKIKMTNQMYQLTSKAKEKWSIFLVVTKKRSVSIAIIFPFLDAEQLINSLAIQFDVDMQK